MRRTRRRMKRRRSKKRKRRGKRKMRREKRKMRRKSRRKKKRKRRGKRKMRRETRNTKRKILCLHKGFLNSEMGRGALGSAAPRHWEELGPQRGLCLPSFSSSLRTWRRTGCRFM